MKVIIYVVNWFNNGDDAEICVFTDKEKAWNLYDKKIGSYDKVNITEHTIYILGAYYKGGVKNE